MFPKHLRRSNNWHCDDVPLLQPGVGSDGKLDLLALDNIFSYGDVHQANEYRSLDSEVGHAQNLQHLLLAGVVIGIGRVN